MSYILYINDFLIELSPEKPVAITKQANDIARLDDRQSNKTNTFNAPLTANNVRNMGKLYVVGNNSNIPYQRNVANLFDADSGECIIYNGWATIKKSSSKGYEIYVYDGNIDLYKAIENQTLADLDLTDVKHNKDLDTVLDSFAGNLPYKYILADYNGKAMFDVDKINIDYLVPAIKVSWLWDKMFQELGFTYSGVVFSHKDFKNWYITYPKGTPTDLGLTEIFLSNDLVQETDSDKRFLLSDAHYLEVNSLDHIEELNLQPNNRYFKTDESLTLKINFNLNFRIIRYFINKGLEEQQSNSNMDLFININGIETFLFSFRATGASKSFEYSMYAPRNSNFFFYIKLGINYSIYPTTKWSIDNGGFIDLKISKSNLLNIDFVNELAGIKKKDFFNEVLWHFGLTSFKSKYTNHFTFKKIQERIDVTNVIDWSDKYISQEGEEYIYGNYGKRNYLKHKYNDENANYNDGYFDLQNENLKDRAEAIKSIIFSPENIKSGNLGFESNVYKLWNKEPKDDGTVDYKALQNRFYFMRSVDKTFSSPVAIGSEYLLSETEVTTAPLESFERLKFREIVKTNYPDIIKLVNKSKLKTFLMNLNPRDVSQIDLSVPYFIEQQSGYFLINRILEFKKNSPTKVEFIEIKDPINRAHFSRLHFSSFDFST